MIVIILAQNPFGIAFGILKLPPLQRPEKGGKANTPEDQRNRDQIGEHFHGYFNLYGYFNRSEFSETVIELRDIAKAAASGVARPTSARGTATML